MALNPTHCTTQHGLVTPPPEQQETQPPTPPATPPHLAIQPNLQPPDQFQLTTPAGQPNHTASAPSGLRFGSNLPPKAHHSGPGAFKKIAAGGLAVLSGVGLGVAIPAGLLQLAAGILFHPFLISGAITLALPFIGMIGSGLLLFSGRKK